MANGNGGKTSASKTTKRVTANKNILAGFNAGKNANSKTSASRTKSSGTAEKAAKTSVVAAASVAAVKVAKKTGVKSIAVILICFILALAVGAGVCVFIGKNDKFDILGAEHIFLQVNEKYSDEGVNIREFGINLSNKASVETDLAKDKDGNYYAKSAGDYYIAYTIKSLKFGLIYPIQKIRLISVISASEGGE